MYRESDRSRLVLSLLRARNRTHPTSWAWPISRNMGFFWAPPSAMRWPYRACIDEAGGQMGAFTGRDYTCFYANVLKDYSPYALELLGDILLNSTFPEDHIKREKSRILRELEMSADDSAS